MTAAIYDFAAIAKLTKAFAEEPPQNEVKPIEPGPTEESHVYGYGEGTDYVYLVTNGPVQAGAPVTSGTGTFYVPMGLAHIGNDWVPVTWQDSHEQPERSNLGPDWS